MKKIIIINGCGGVGKDTFISYFIQHFCINKKQRAVFNLSSVDVIKQAAKILGWNGQKNENDRMFLSDLKDLSSNYNSGPFNYICDQINQLYVEDKHTVFFIHSREPDEIERFKLTFGSELYTLLITRPGQIILTNHADRDVENYTYDFVINNDLDFNKFNEQCKSFCQEIFINDQLI